MSGRETGKALGWIETLALQMAQELSLEDLDLLIRCLPTCFAPFAVLMSS